MLRSYDVMTATARRQPEGSLVYIIDRTDLYLRVRDGVRQVQVKYSQVKERDKNTPHVYLRCFLLCCFSSGATLLCPVRM